MAQTTESFEACVARVAATGRIGRERALDLLQEVHDRAEVMRLTGREDPFLQAASELAAKAERKARLDRLDANRNAAIRAKRLAPITGFSNAAQELHDVLRGSNVGHRDNIQSEWTGRAARTLATVRFKLLKASALKAAISGMMDREAYRAIWAKNAETAAEGISSLARVMADAYQPVLEEMRNLMNSFGARIAHAPDYVVHTWHDPDLLRRGGWGSKERLTANQAFERWWSFTEPKASDKTFEHLANPTSPHVRRTFARAFFDATASGVHMTADGMNGLNIDEDGNFIPAAFEGTRNVARKVSEPRVIFWKDADANYEYNLRYGRFRTLYEGVQASIGQGSRNIALMEKLGTNPEANFNQIVKAVQEKYRADLDGGRKFQGGISSLKNELAQLTGEANRPANAMWSSINEGARQWFRMTSLGGVGVTHFASIWATIPAELRHHGAGAGLDGLANIGRVMQMIVRAARSPAEQREIMTDTGAYVGGFTYRLAHDWHTLFEPGNTKMGRLAALHSMFMEATGVHSLFEAARWGLREFAAHNLARQLDRPLEGLEPHLRQMLGKYGIKAPEWEQLRALDNLPSWEGRAYLTPTDAMRTPGGHALSDKLMMYYQDIADHGVVVPGVRERAALYGGTRAGSLPGEVWRHLTQFKIWPLAAANQMLGREIHMALSAKDAAWGIGLTIALSTMAGYMRMAVTDLAYGNKLRDPAQPTVLLAALAQGGGLGIMGDLMFGEFNRLGAEGLVSLGGPIASDADQLLHIRGRWTEAMRTGKHYDPWPDLLQFGRYHVPFANLVYLKGALDYMLWYHLLEAARPGFWERSNRRMQIEQGRTMAGYVPGAGVPWGVPGIYLRTPAGTTSGLFAR